MNFLQPAFIQNFGAQELILIFLVVLLFFGAKRMPELFRSFGKSIKEFKKATSDVQDDIRTAIDTEDEPSEGSKITEQKAVKSTVASDDDKIEKAAKSRN